eukprot:scaffold62362_cov62-Phaeocystis_antarctica.AAC.3
MSGRPPTYCPNLTKTEPSATSCAHTGAASSRCSADHARSSQAAGRPARAAAASSLRASM